MTNEEAFEKWFVESIGELKYPQSEPAILAKHNAKAGWQAAIAYMQEQNKLAEQSEPVATIYNGNAYWIGKEPPEGTNLFTTPQRKQPLKRLDEDRIDDIFNSYSDEQGYVAIDDWHLLTNAIMDAMQELNK